MTREGTARHQIRQGKARKDTGRHGKAREDMGRHGKTQEDKVRDMMAQARGTRYEMFPSRIEFNTQ